MINAVGPAWFLTNRGNSPRQRPKIVMDEFIRCFTPKTVNGACRDYRAGATINFEMDAADKDKQIATPLLVLWGTRGAPPTDEFPTVWRKFATQSRGHRAARHRPLHTRGNARAVSGPFLQILCRLTL